MSQLESEIAEIPARLEGVAAANRAAFAAAAQRYRAAAPPALFTIARGTSDAVARYAGYRLTQALGLPVGSFAPSLASLDQVRPRAQGLWTLAISQSGRSPDLIAAQESFARPGCLRLALVNDTTAPLATGGTGLNGTGVGRPGARPGGIGGPAKVAAGISGTAMRTGR